MVQISFKTFDGKTHEVEAEPGATIMEIARDNGIEGIDADCGGQCACATCHVFIDAEWQSKLDERSEMEGDMLECSTIVRATSRLSCQIPVTPALDGMVVELPEFQE
ncbi:2Fe-2S iron-sulfur cluster-binding protein [Altererythrobacter arenosus]|uniref:2Fe-2S iron-sulfur cluster-binding protein n=1 Tax=Altererythrobacter arenosus TaxID=3032592 RepID=A0ABY8FS32_9SPHN|nr:2Fe-2S iron-sulfur cluster-binding protein [Altererythrobacter sp. CAU 1644]WFL77572.1 2Fe-2S iron-sulfur cluster-binding protein [Altererythrobacter sp. CAU 1644]